MFERKKRNYKIMVSLANRTLLAIIVAIIAFCFLGISNAQAAVLLLDEGNDLRNNGSGNWGGTVGVRFTVESLPILVTSLGIWDGPGNETTGSSEGDGLEEGTTVGLWNDSGSLLDSVSIAAGIMGSFVDGSTAACVYASITPVTLNANTTYRVGALYTNGGSAFMNSGGSFNTSVNVTHGVFASGSFDFPGSTDTQNHFGSATMQFSVVPIPGALWLLGSGLISIVGIRRKFRK